MSGKKKMKKKSYVETGSLLSGIDSKNAIEIEIVHLEIQEGEVELGTLGQLTVHAGSQLIGLADGFHLPKMGGRQSIDYRCLLQIPEVDEVVLDALISTPIFFSLSTASEQKKGTAKPKKKTAAESKTPSANDLLGKAAVVGEGNLDILPLLTGGGVPFEETVVLETGGYTDSLFFPSTWSEKPRLLVRLREVGDWSSELKGFNVMWITVESIFNPSETYLSPEYDFTAVFAIPVHQVEVLSASDISEDDGETKMDNRRSTTKPDMGHGNGDAGRRCQSALGGWAAASTELLSSITDSTGSEVAALDGNRRGSRQEEDSGSLSSDSESFSSGSRLTLDATKQKKKGDSGDLRNKVDAKSAESLVSGRKANISARLLDYKLLEFNGGIWKDEPELDLRKKWSCFTKLSGGPSKHRSRVCSDSRGILSKFKVDLKNKMTAEQEPKITWNMIRPFLLDDDTEQTLIRRIYKYGVWPLEVMVRPPPAGQDKKKDLGGGRSLIAWLDLSTLLYPGNDSVRVAGQLQLFDQDEAEQLWGLKTTLLANPMEHSKLGDTSVESSRGSSKKKFKSELKKDSTRGAAPITEGSFAGGSQRGVDFKGLHQLPTKIDGKNKKNEKDSNAQVTNSEIEETTDTSYNMLEKDYIELKRKYDKLYAFAFCSSALSLSEEDLPAAGGHKKHSEIDDPEEKAMHALLLAKDAIHEWSSLEYKKTLMKRYSLSLLKKRMNENLVLHKPEYLSSNGEPTFVVVEIKLLRPLIPSKPIEAIEADVKQLLPDRSEEKLDGAPIERFTPDDLHSAITKLCRLIAQEYQDFQSFEFERESSLDGEKFYEHLERSMVHQQVSEAIRDVLSSYVRDTVGTPPSELRTGHPTSRDYVDWLYCRLVDEVQSIVNVYVLDKDNSVPESFSGNSPNISSEQLYVFASEAAEEGDYEKAKFYMSKALRGEGLRDAGFWAQLAVISLRMSDYPRAVEALREGLALNIRNKECLMMYAVLLTSAGMFDAAEIFFHALIEFYPSFCEGWLIFHTFYLLVEKKIGCLTALIMGHKFQEEAKARPTYRPLQLSWDNGDVLEGHSAYLSTALYLLSFNLYEMAEVCLAQDLELSGNKIDSLNYYVAVCHHIQGRYEDSCHHVSWSLSHEENVQTASELWLILGHNKWKMGKRKEAVKLYKEAFNNGCKHQVAYMAFLRCGYYFLENEKPDLAKEMFQQALAEYKTPLGWLGYGVALYMLEELEDAELALEEANVLDNQLPTVWAYLGLICLDRNKLNHAQQCFLEARRCGLKDEKIEERIMTISNLKYQETIENEDVCSYMD